MESEEFVHCKKYSIFIDSQWKQGFLRVNRLCLTDKSFYAYAVALATCITGPLLGQHRLVQGQRKPNDHASHLGGVQEFDIFHGNSRFVPILIWRNLEFTWKFLTPMCITHAHGRLAIGPEVGIVHVGPIFHTTSLA